MHDTGAVMPLPGQQIAAHAAPWSARLSRCGRGSGRRRGGRNGAWHRHVEHVRERLTVSYGVEEVTDQLLSTSRRLALDASDPVTRLWGDFHLGCRLTLRLIDGLDWG